MKDSPTGISTVIRGAQTILPHGIEAADLCVADGRIVEVGTGLRGDRVLDATGLMLAPAMVDIHGDAFERQLMPRPGVFFPMEEAILETDRQLAGNGIATAYHAVTFGWAPGLRSAERSRDLVQAIGRLAPRLTVGNRVQIRWETFAFDTLDTIFALLDGPAPASLAFNDHMSMSMRDPDLRVQEREFEHSPRFRVADPGDPRLPARFRSDAERAGMAPEAFLPIALQAWGRRPEVPDVIARVAEAARAAGVPMLSHDDTRAETRAFYRGLGARVCEFPMALDAAQAARDGGDRIIFGAPNVLRGGSHIGSLAAADMVEAGLCDALASDYYYPAMLSAVARLDAERRASRQDLWRLVSAGPAAAMGLSDRGEIAVGRRADLVLIDWPENGAPAVRSTIVNGRVAYMARPFAGSAG